MVCAAATDVTPDIIVDLEAHRKVMVDGIFILYMKSTWQSSRKKRDYKIQEKNIQPLIWRVLF
jgi:hypothetical protein